MDINFKNSLEFVLKSEGKFSDIPDDKGGPTNQGITLATLIKYHKHFDYGDMDQDGDVDIEDIRLLDEPEEAAPIYKRWFWDKVRGDDLPPGLDYVVFDSAVNHGPRSAGRLLQRAINRYGANLEVDGIIGFKTLRHCQAGTEVLIQDALRERDTFYRKIVAQDKSQEIFLKGWLNRIAQVAVNARSFVWEGIIDSMTRCSDG